MLKEWLIKKSIIDSAKKYLTDARKYQDGLNVRRVFWIKRWMEAGYITYAEILTTPEELLVLESIGYKNMAEYILAEVRRNSDSVSSGSIESWLIEPREYFNLSEIGTNAIEVAAVMTRAVMVENVRRANH